MKSRLDTVDAARGLAVVVMLVCHLMYDLVTFCGAPEYLCSSPLWSCIQALFAGVFFFVSGLCAYGSRRVLKRGVVLLVLAAAVSVVTSLFGYPVRFGALHLLGCAMVLYHLTRGLWDSLPERAAFAVYIILMIASVLVTSRPVGADFLWVLGFRPAEFYSADYYPLLPWLFVFLCGTRAGKTAADGRFPPWFYTARVRVLPFFGRHSLVIYLLHQPVYIGILAALGYV